MNNIIPIQFDYNQSVVSPNEHVTINVDNNKIGGEDMNDKYVTKDELQLQTQLLNSQVDNKISQLEGKIDSQAKIIDEKFNTLNAKIDGQFKALDEKFNTLNSKIDGKFDSFDEKLNSQSVKIDGNSKITWWIMSVISAGIIIPAITLVVKIIISK